jgi:hypothetical protein
MTRKPGDHEPEPPGGRAAERLREFLKERFGEGTGPPDESSEQPEEPEEDERGKDQPADQEDRKDR